jgi:tol-pal system protein YbgF
MGVSNDLELVIIDTQKRVRKLNEELGSSVEQLNSTTTELYARVNAAEDTSMRLQNVVEENQRRLDDLTRDLSDFRNTLYRHFNLSVGAGGASAGFDSSPVVVEPPVAPATFGTAVNDPLPAGPPPAGVAPSNAPDPVDLYTKAQRTFASAQDNPTLNAQAISEFDAFLAQYPNTPRLSANAHFWKGKSYLNLAQYENAIGTFEQLRTQFPTEDKVPFAMQNQAVAHNALGQVDRAIALLEEVIAKFPASPVAEQARLDLQKLKGSGN